MRESCFIFLNRSMPFFTKEHVILKPREQRFVKIEALFIDEISGLVTTKMLDKKAQSALMLNLKFVRNSATWDATNSSLETVIIHLKEMLGILDLRSKLNMGYCKKSSASTTDLNPQMYQISSLINL